MINNEIKVLTLKEIVKQLANLNYRIDDLRKEVEQLGQAEQAELIEEAYQSIEDAGNSLDEAIS